MFKMQKLMPLIGQGAQLLAIWSRLPGDDKAKIEIMVSTLLPNLPLEGKFALLRDKLVEAEGNLPSKLMRLAVDPEVHDALSHDEEQTEGELIVSAVRCRSCGFMQDISV